MPQLVLIALAGASVLAGYRWVKRQIAAEAARASKEAAETTAGAMRDLGPLTWDEASGAYRPARRE
jgi:hypothetical protein